MEIVKYVTDNSQVCAAIVSSLAGIAGIFINIGVNVHYRHRDYENRNRANIIENLDTYYLPLLDVLVEIRELIGKMIDNNQINQGDLTCLSVDKVSGSYAANAKQFRESIAIANKTFELGGCHFQDDYKLFQAHRAVKRKVELLNKYFIGCLVNGNFSIKSFSSEIDMLIYRIQCCEIAYMEKHCLVRLHLRWKIHKELKKYADHCE